MGGEGAVGRLDGVMEGFQEGKLDSYVLGSAVGWELGGLVVAVNDGCGVGCGDGWRVGEFVCGLVGGEEVGNGVFTRLGAWLGLAV